MAYTLSSILTTPHVSLGLAAALPAATAELTNLIQDDGALILLWSQVSQHLPNETPLADIYPPLGRAKYRCNLCLYARNPPPPNYSPLGSRERQDNLR